MYRILYIILLLIVPVVAMGINDKDIRKSLEIRDFKNVQIEVLRVKNRKIDSPAQKRIKEVQRSLDECYKLLGRKQNIHYKLAYIKECINKIQLSDAHWPVSYYQNEVERLSRWNKDLHEGTKVVRQVQADTTLSVDGDVVRQVQADTTLSVDGDKKLVMEQEYEGSEKTDNEIVEIKDEKNLALRSTASRKDNTGNYAGVSDTGKRQVNETQEKNTSPDNNHEVNKRGQIKGLITLIVIIVIWIVYRRYSRRCSSCGKWNAMKTYKKKYNFRERSSYDEKSKRWLYTYYYTHYRQCKYCGYSDSVEKSETK